ncbi:MAG: hypothetical protein M0Q01_03885 [Syntrophales bacterium]|jgi:hypothetical protein|nr:hypothetical protein [Syntrophales bacterium]
MRKRTLHTSVNLLIQPGLYQRLKMAATLKKTSMSKLIREGIKLRLDQIDKQNNVIQLKEDQDHECTHNEETR